MKALIPCTFEVNIVSLTAVMPVRHGDECIPYTCPCRDADYLTLEINVDTGKILDWPVDRPMKICMKVVDNGCYSLLGFRQNDETWIRQWDNMYVPSCLGGGDYLEIEITDRGFIKNWSFSPEEFLEKFDCDD